MALIAQLGEHCTGIAEVVGSNPAQSLKFFSGLCSSSVTAALALTTVITQFATVGQITFTLIVYVVLAIFSYLFPVSPISTTVLNTLDT